MSLLKKTLSFVLCAIMVLSIVPFGNVEAEAASVTESSITAKLDSISKEYKGKSFSVNKSKCNHNGYTEGCYENCYLGAILDAKGISKSSYNYEGFTCWAFASYCFTQCFGKKWYENNENNNYTIIPFLGTKNATNVKNWLTKHASVGDILCWSGHYAVIRDVSSSGVKIMDANVGATTSKTGTVRDEVVTFDYIAAESALKLHHAVNYNTKNVYFKSISQSNITKTNAKITAELYGTYIGKAGCYIGTSTDSMKKYTETINEWSNKVWYEMDDNVVNSTLKPNTTYYYKIFVTVNGVEYCSEVKSFKTLSHTLSVYYNANGGSISSDTYYLSSGNIYKSSDNSKHCQKWTYNEPQKYGLYDYTTFGISKSGYEFLGWSTTSSGELWFDQNDTELLPTHLNADIKNGDCSVTMYAVWRKVSTAYTLSYNANGGSGAPSSQSGATSYTVSSTKPTRSGYTFLGWSTSSNATSASYAGGDTISLSANTTLYAVWEEIPVHVTYELVYDANGGSGAPESLSFLENQTIYISEEIPTRFGYVFEGWVSQDGFWYYPGQEAMFFEATVLYASWSNHKLSSDESIVLEITDECQDVFVEFSPEESGVYAFKSFDTQDKLDTTGVLYDTNGTELVSDDDNGDGNNFMFYYTVYAGETYYIKVSSFNSEEGTFGFEIIPAYYVTYNANGGQIILGGSGIEEVPDLSTTIPYIEVVREGYTFAGWSEDRTSQYATYTEGDELYLDSNITLYAVWEKIDSPLNPEPDDDLDLPGFLTIRTPSVTTIKYGDSIVLHADLENVPLTGLKVTWEASNDNFEIISVSEDGSECVITPKKSGDTTFTATVKIGTLAFSTDTQVMTAKAGFFQKIIAFFKNLFGLTKTIPEAFNYAY